MAIVSKAQLKNWFRNGLKPAQEQFWNWMDSFWHKDEKIPSSSIDGLESYFNDIASDLNSRAMRDASNISEVDAQKWRNLLGNIDSSKEILSGIEDPNQAEIAGEIGQFYNLKDETETVDIALYIFTGVDSIGWLNLGIYNSAVQLHYGAFDDPNSSTIDAEIGDYYLQTIDGTQQGEIKSFWIYTGTTKEPWVNPAGNVGLSGKDGKDGEDGKDGVSPHVGTNGNWWVGDRDTGVSAMPASLQIRYDSEISGLRDGINKTFTINEAYVPGTLKVYFNGILLSKGNNADFIEVDAGTSGNGAVINRVISSKDKLIFEFEKWG